MKYLSVCSGIEAATVAWHTLGWKPLAFSEIECFPRKVLAHHYPDVPIHGDFTVLRDQDWIGNADLLVGGTPCQAFSVAGLRQSLSDERGNLTLEFVRLANAIDDIRHSRGAKPAIIVWENVPGVLSVKDNAFGCFLAALVGNDAPLIPTGGKWTNAGLVVGPKRSAAWRVLDAQYFGVAQRRRRVFVVAGAGDGFDPAEVLFEREGMRRDTAPRREQRKDVAETAGTISASGSGTGRPGGQGSELDFYIPSIVGALGARHDSSPCADHGQNMVAQPMAFAQNTRDEVRYINGDGQIVGALAAESGMKQTNYIAQTMAVRRLTPRECERLQGFPDDYTDIPSAADGPRYKALGNSMAVPVMRWIGNRIDSYNKKGNLYD